MAGSDLRKAAGCFFEEPYDFIELGGSSGFSRSVFARVEISGMAWCVRRWPPGFGESRLRFVHSVLARCRSKGFTGVPALADTSRGDTVLNLGGNLFDAQEWLVGRPVSSRTSRETSMPNPVCHLPDAQLKTLADALARFHQATGGTPENDQEKMPLSRRLTRISPGAEGRDDLLAAGVRLRGTGEDRRVALRWLDLLPEALAFAGATLRDHPGVAGNVSSLGHGDLWASHVYFDGTSFVGFVDFESLGFGSRTFDLAQLILHFNGWASYDTVLNAYEKVSQLEEEEKMTLPAAAIIDLAGEGYWSLGALYGKNSAELDYRRARVHATNLRALLRSLESIVAGVF